MTFKLGKKPARAWGGGSHFRLSRYADTAALPPLPRNFGHGSLISAWPMFANDRYGDCVWAGAAHETMLLGKEAGNTFAFTDANVLSDYGAVTGFNSDNLGIIDETGERHTIAAFLGIDPADTQHTLLAAYMFVCGVGLRLPSSALDQADKAQVWDVVTGSPIEGGHYVPLIGRHDDQLVFVSWGRIQYATERFLAAYCDEAVAYLSQENLINQRSPEGLDYKTLCADLKDLE